jgi:nucleoid-associated protein YgaU
MKLAHEGVAVKNTFAIGMILAAAAAGCSNTGKKTANSTITEPLTPAPVAYTPAPQPYTPPPTAAQPVVYDSTPAPMQASAAPAVAGSGNYTVKKGDTLFSIAKSRYGNGNQYTKIVAANPGLSPQSLKAGQTINIP